MVKVVPLPTMLNRSGPPTLTMAIILLDGLYQRFDFLSSAGSSEDWLLACDSRGSQIMAHDGKLSQIFDIELQMIMWQAHDAYILGLGDLVPPLCRTALEAELTSRYLTANKLWSSIGPGHAFKNLLPTKTAKGKTITPRANLENLITWAKAQGIITPTTDALASDIQDIGNDFAHAYAMRKAGQTTGVAPLYNFQRALQIYVETLDLILSFP